MRSRAKTQECIETLNQDEGTFEGGLPILIHVEKFEGGPILGMLLQKEIIAEIINGCVQEYPVTIDTMNEYECVMNMPKR